MADQVEPATAPAADTKSVDDEQSFAAATQVLATPELLENILLNLSVRNLFGVLCTSKGFHDTINGSLKLQRAMFLRDDPAVVYDWYSPALNPLLNKLVFVCSENVAKGMIDGAQFAGQERGELLTGYRASDRNDERSRFRDLYLMFEYKAKCGRRRRPVWIHKAIQPKDKKNDLVYVQQSWRRTIVAQGTPAQDLHMDVCNDVVNWSKLPWWAPNPHYGATQTDMTLGDAIDHIEELLRDEIEESELVLDYPGYEITSQ